MRLHIPDDVETLGAAIRWARTQRKLTGTALAVKLGVSLPFLSDVEHGRRSLANVEHVAAILGVPVNELLSRKLAGSIDEWRKKNPEMVELLKELHKSGQPCPWCGKS